MQSNEYDPDRKLAMVIDEWGCWHKDGSGPSNGGNLYEQQSSMRDAIVAAMTLNIFNNRCDIVKMANIAQLCNNLHSLYLASGENFVETPNYHVFDMYKSHQGGRQIDAAVASDIMNREGFRPMQMVSASASEKDDSVTITLANLHMTEPVTVNLTAVGGSIAGKGTVTVLTHEYVHACNTFENPAAVIPSSYDANFTGSDIIELPAAAVVSRRRKINGLSCPQLSSRKIFSFLYS